MLCAAGAALGFGTYFVLLHEAAAGDPYLATAYTRIWGGISALILAALWRARPAGRAHPVVALLPVGVGTLETLADGAFALAAAGGALGLSAILASLYPAVTVVLNASVLRERLPAVHLAGVVSALVGVACLAS
ncbi:EamA family transporter [Actinoplanes sp. NPDC051851]|uniref:EamA family transporter n=1 Tax=Actinoplanes sp. NPDC051851 TaxID=3154753 RepID=UPI00343165CB